MPSETRRDQILNAAERLLLHYGFAKTTVADIAREAGVGVGSVYLEFSSKDEVVAALSRRGHQAALEAMATRLAAEGACLGRLQAALDARLRHFHALSEAGYHALDLVQCRCPAVGEVHARFREQEEALLARFLREAHRAKELAAPDATLAARCLLRVLDVFMPAHTRGLDRDELWRLVAATEKLLFDGLRRR
jgi:AcrR family transcriptional regulator